MPLRHICIEVRKNLCCANVFLQFEHSLTKTACLKISVDGQRLRLFMAHSIELVIPLSPLINVEASTLSNLTVEQSNASFRLTITSLKEEVEEPIEPKSSIKHIPPELNEGFAIDFYCSNCKCALLLTPQVFLRVREFPTGSIDLSEFFCHNGPDLAATLVPQKTDLFYGYQFLILNTELLRGATKEKDEQLYCRRCLQHLGEILFEGCASKVWTDSIQLKYNTETTPISLMSPSPAELLYKIIDDCAVLTQPEPLLRQMQFTKVLLETCLPTTRQRQFMLLHILEKRLPVLRNMERLIMPSAVDTDETNNLTIHLTSCYCIKLLYRLVQAKPEGVAAKTLLAAWQQDLSIHSLKISPTLFCVLLKELQQNSLMLPQLYRYSRDEFLLSYIF